MNKETTENKELQNKYITVNQAKELCIEAHKEQWRRKVDSTYSPQKQQYEDYINEFGNKVTFTDGDDRWKEQQPYSSHPIAVAEMMNTDEEKIVAYLHDVFEDCDGWELTTREDYKKYYYIVDPESSFIEISERVHFTLDTLTKEKHVPYKDYIQNIIDAHKYYNNSLPIKVKIADMFHNMSDNPSERQKTKYAKGLKLLLGAL